VTHEEKEEDTELIQRVLNLIICQQIFSETSPRKVSPHPHIV